MWAGFVIESDESKVRTKGKMKFCSLLWFDHMRFYSLHEYPKIVKLQVCESAHRRSFFLLLLTPFFSDGDKQLRNAPSDPSSPCISLLGFSESVTSASGLFEHFKSHPTFCCCEIHAFLQNFKWNLLLLFYFFAKNHELSAVFKVFWKITLKLMCL